MAQPGFAEEQKSEPLTAKVSGRRSHRRRSFQQSTLLMKKVGQIIVTPVRGRSIQWMTVFPRARLRTSVSSYVRVSMPSHGGHTKGHRPNCVTNTSNVDRIRQVNSSRAHGSMNACMHERINAPTGGIPKSGARMCAQEQTRLV